MDYTYVHACAAPSVPPTLADIADIGDCEKLVQENESVYITATQWHRLENPGKVALEMIEVQLGSYLGEDDIIRTDDIYHPATDETR